MKPRLLLLTLLITISINFSQLTTRAYSAPRIKRINPMVVYGDDVLFGRENKIWGRGDEGYWELVAQIADDKAVITSFVEINNILFVGTRKITDPNDRRITAALWEYDGETLRQASFDPIGIGQDKAYYAVKNLNNKLVIIGTHGLHKLLGGSDEGLWTWNLLEEDPIKQWKAVETFKDFADVTSILVVNELAPEIIVGTYTDGIFKGAIEGTWELMEETERSGGTVVSYRAHIVTLSKGGNEENPILYAGSVSDDVRSAGFFLYETEAVGWEQIITSWIDSETNVYKVVSDPDSNHPKGVWATTDDSLLFSDNAGDPWLTILGGSSDPIEFNGLLISDDQIFALSECKVYVTALENARQSDKDIWEEELIKSESCPEIEFEDESYGPIEIEEINGLGTEELPASEKQVKPPQEGDTPPEGAPAEEETPQPPYEKTPVPPGIKPGFVCDDLKNYCVDKWEVCLLLLFGFSLFLYISIRSFIKMYRESWNPIEKRASRQINWWPVISSNQAILRLYLRARDVDYMNPAGRYRSDVFQGKYYVIIIGVDGKDQSVTIEQFATDATKGKLNLDPKVQGKWVINILTLIFSLQEGIKAHFYLDIEGKGRDKRIGGLIPLFEEDNKYCNFGNFRTVPASETPSTPRTG